MVKPLLITVATFVVAKLLKRSDKPGKRNEFDRCSRHSKTSLKCYATSDESIPYFQHTRKLLNKWGICQECIAGIVTLPKSVSTKTLTKECVAMDNSRKRCGELPQGAMSYRQSILKDLVVVISKMMECKKACTSSGSRERLDLRTDTGLNGGAFGEYAQVLMSDEGSCITPADCGGAGLYSYRSVGNPRNCDASMGLEECGHQLTSKRQRYKKQTVHFNCHTESCGLDADVHAFDIHPVNRCRKASWNGATGTFTNASRDGICTPGGRPKAAANFGNFAEKVVWSTIEISSLAKSRMRFFCNSAYNASSMELLADRCFVVGADLRTPTVVAYSMIAFGHVVKNAYSGPRFSSGDINNDLASIPLQGRGADCAVPVPSCLSGAIQVLSGADEIAEEPGGDTITSTWPECLGGSSPWSPSIQFLGAPIPAVSGGGLLERPFVQLIDLRISARINPASVPRLVHSWTQLLEEGEGLWIPGEEVGRKGFRPTNSTRSFKHEYNFMEEVIFENGEKTEESWIKMAMITWDPGGLGEGRRTTHNNRCTCTTTKWKFDKKPVVSVVERSATVATRSGDHTLPTEWPQKIELYAKLKFLLEDLQDCSTRISLSRSQANLTHENVMSGSTRKAAQAITCAATVSRVNETGTGVHFSTSVSPFSSPECSWNLGNVLFARPGLSKNTTAVLSATVSNRSCLIPEVGVLGAAVRAFREDEGVGKRAGRR
ncbi:hypothetical protein BSKO_10585 [Bryopsis sp. KO-2023]|nr:hypothetical protein BSKO_10585 [Bryopsis sp. KO-2023]